MFFSLLVSFTVSELLFHIKHMCGCLWIWAHSQAHITLFCIPFRTHTERTLPEKANVTTTPTGQTTKQLVNANIHTTIHTRLNVRMYVVFRTKPIYTQRYIFHFRFVVSFFLLSMLLLCFYSFFLSVLCLPRITVVERCESKRVHIQTKAI